jgi:hypothetical protein
MSRNQKVQNRPVNSYRKSPQVALPRVPQKLSYKQEKSVELKLYQSKQIKKPKTIVSTVSLCKGWHQPLVYKEPIEVWIEVIEGPVTREMLVPLEDTRQFPEMDGAIERMVQTANEDFELLDEMRRYLCANCTNPSNLISIMTVIDEGIAALKLEYISEMRLKWSLILLDHMMNSI